MKKNLFYFLIMVSKLAAFEQSPEWTVESGKIDPNNYFGVTLANGMIGLVSSPEPMKMNNTMMNGVFDSYGRGRVSNTLTTFNHANMELEVDGKRLKDKKILNHRQVLDMKKAVLTTTFDIEEQLSVTYSIRALRHLPYTCLIQLHFLAKKDVEIKPSSWIEAPPHLFDIRNFYSEVDCPHVKIPLLTSAGKSPSGKYTLAVSNCLIFTDDKGQEPRLIHEDCAQNKHSLKFQKNLRAGETFSFSIASSLTSSKDYQDPINEAERLSIFAALQKKDQLVKRHEAEWEKLWQGDILIENELQAQQEVRLALYHLYSFLRAGTSSSLPPMGLSAIGYNGHIFWDAELWMFPPLLVLQPELARSILEYRFYRLEAAKLNAMAHGYKGAMFPWESADEGMEETPVWALTGPFQHHITGCIGWACWKYYLVTRDKQWLQEKGYPILKEVADFWTSRVERKGSGRFEINNVIGANEWQENVDNNAFTNAVAITALEYAVKAAKELEILPDPDWELVAQNIPVLHFPNGVTRENSTYNGETIKQADVNLLAYPLEIIRDPLQIEKDLKFYEPRLSADGPAMGYAMLSVLYSRLGNPDKGYELFAQSYRPNKEMPFGVLSESLKSKNPYFSTAAGGMLHAILFGFGGLYISDQGIVRSEIMLPSNWANLTIKLPIKDVEIHLSQTHTEST